MIITLNQLKVLAFTMPSKDVRSYLNGLFIGSEHIVTTDGHRLSCIKHNDEEHNAPDFIIPASMVDIMLKSKQPLFSVVLQDNNIVINNGMFTCKPIDGKFPDYKRVIPVACYSDGTIPIIQGSYLHDAQKALNIYANYSPSKQSYPNGVTIEHKGANTAVKFELKDLVIVIMPIRLN
jgi:hypothetical protein